jgi:hypothetical protein
MGIRETQIIGLSEEAEQSSAVSFLSAFLKSSFSQSLFSVAAAIENPAIAASTAIPTTMALTRDVLASNSITFALASLISDGSCSGLDWLVAAGVGVGFGVLVCIIIVGLIHIAARSPGSKPDVTD